MNLEALAEPEKAIIGNVLRAPADGPFFPDWEFGTLFGLERSKVRAIADTWPDADSTPQEVSLAVNGSLNNLLGYPHGMDAVWSQWIPVDPRKLRELFTRLRDHREETFFDRMM